jgi:hypothetical protein
MLNYLLYHAYVYMATARKKAKSKAIEKSMIEAFEVWGRTPYDFE